jgi:glycosyltransferase involved in cell wall biosynthesis
LKIVIISPYQYRLKRGIERFTACLANSLADRGVTVILYVWSGSRGTIFWGDLKPGITMRKVPALRYLQSRAASWYYRRWLKNDQPDITILNFFYHGEHLLPVNKKYLYILHSPASEIPGRYRFIQKQIKYFESIEFVAVSHMVKKEAVPYLGNKPVWMIYNGVDTSAFVPVKKTKENYNKIKLITAAALEERKGIQYMIHMLGNNSKTQREHIQYDIYGEGSYKPVLLELIRHYHLENCITIQKPVNNLQEILPEYDLFCLMSRGEGMGIAPLEALACGLPVLCSDRPPFDEYISPDIGFSVNPDDHEAMMRFILNLENPDIRVKYSLAAREKSLQFSWDIAADHYLNLLTKIKNRSFLQSTHKI